MTASVMQRNVWRVAKRPDGDIADGDLVYGAALTRFELSVNLSRE